MNAKIARQISDNVITKNSAVDNIRITSCVNSILNDIRDAASNGSKTVLFSPKGLKNEAEIWRVKTELKKLGFYFTEESDNGLNYTLINW